jgi:hypothetical protein
MVRQTDRQKDRHADRLTERERQTLYKQTDTLTDRQRKGDRHYTNRQNKFTKQIYKTNGQTDSIPDCITWEVCRVGTYPPVAALNPAQSYGKRGKL